jgi:hypothetical protein
MLRVFDTGTPIMSATQSFSVTVNPLVTPTIATSFAGGQFLPGQRPGRSATGSKPRPTSRSGRHSHRQLASVPFTWTDARRRLSPTFLSGESRAPLEP